MYGLRTPHSMAEIEKTAFTPAMTLKALKSKNPAVRALGKLWAGILSSPSLQHASGDVRRAVNMGTGMGLEWPAADVAIRAAEGMAKYLPKPAVLKKLVKTSEQVIGVPMFERVMLEAQADELEKIAKKRKLKLTKQAGLVSWLTGGVKKKVRPTPGVLLKRKPPTGDQKAELLRLQTERLQRQLAG